ncbi:MAG: hypothetical protein IH626_07195 [Rhodospirillales bacterium]|nr:hypothetical protein [Rhodospirillales bacterium]
MRLFLAIAVGAMIATGQPGTQPAAAQSRLDPLETTEEARQRHGALRWNEYQRRGGQPPLGGYKETIGDPAPPGTPEPGYAARPVAGSDGGRKDATPAGGATGK